MGFASSITSLLSRGNKQHSNHRLAPSLITIMCLASADHHCHSRDHHDIDIEAIVIGATTTARPLQDWVRPFEETSCRLCANRCIHPMLPLHFTQPSSPFYEREKGTTPTATSPTTAFLRQSHQDHPLRHLYIVWMSLPPLWPPPRVPLESLAPRRSCLTRNFQPSVPSIALKKWKKMGHNDVSFNLNEISKLMLVTLCMYIWCRKSNLDKESLRLQTTYKRNWKVATYLQLRPIFFPHIFHWH